MASFVGMAEAAEYLVGYGVPVDIATGNGYTPLMASVDGEQQHVYGRLIWLGADPHVKDGGGRSAWTRLTDRLLPELDGVLSGAIQTDLDDDESRRRTISR